METHDLLFELGTEELPPRNLKGLRDSLQANLAEKLVDAALDHGEIKAFATPRRLAIKIAALAERQQDKDIERKGPAAKAAYDDNGQPSKALQGFMRSCGIDDVKQLDTLVSDKGEWVVYRGVEPGKAMKDILPELIQKSLAALPIERRMRWGEDRAEFVRPVKWMMMLWGETVIPASFLGVSAGNKTRGHRFMSSGELTINKASDYESSMRDGHVIADFDERRAIVKSQIETQAKGVNGSLEIDEALLDEVTALVEWPCALTGNFDREFLAVPEEALVSAMKTHQRYFHLRDANGSLMPHFITVANLDSKEPARVSEGNERVIRPRLSDAAFFYNKDTGTSLESNLERMKNVVFQEKLGSYFSKAERIASLARFIADRIGADPDASERAGYLAKADLVSEMVGEFPELQGTMGGYYARHDGEGDVVAAAIEQHYRPTHSGDQLPESTEACAVAIADKIDTLVGIFGIGQPPSGSRDPFALRRQTLGVIRMCVEKALPLDIPETLEHAAGLFDQSFETTELLGYLLDRMAGWYADSDVKTGIFDAVRGSHLGIRSLSDCHERVTALKEFQAHPKAESLIAANKRVANLLKKAGDVAESPNESRFTEPAEKRLFEAILSLGNLDNLSYEDRLLKLASVQEDVDAYFDDVMVMADDPAIKKNRIATLAELRSTFLAVADFSLIQQ